MFFNRCLIDAKIKYWFTEFETTGLVWTVRKIKHMFNAFRNRFQMVIYIDHSVTIFIIKQIKLTTNNTDKFNFRLIRVFIYFSQFELYIKHKPGKLHVILDVLFLLFKKISQAKFAATENIFDTYHVQLIVENELFPIYHIILVKMADYFKQRFKFTRITNNGNGFSNSFTHKTEKTTRRRLKGSDFNTATVSFIARMNKTAENVFVCRKH